MPTLRDMIISPWRAVSVLGITQIIAWGTIFYSPVLIAPLIAAEHGWSLSFTMSGFSLGLLIAGLVSPTVGRSIDSRGGHVVMTAGALVSAAARPRRGRGAEGHARGSQSPGAAAAGQRQRVHAGDCGLHGLRLRAVGAFRASVGNLRAHRHRSRHRRRDRRAVRPGAGRGA